MSKPRVSVFPALLSICMFWAGICLNINPWFSLIALILALVLSVGAYIRLWID